LVSFVSRPRIWTSGRRYYRADKGKHFCSCRDGRDKEAAIPQKFRMSWDWLADDQAQLAGSVLAVTTARHIKSVYRIVSDEMLVYAGPLEIPVAGSTEVKEGDLVISFSSRPVLQARLAGQEDWLAELLFSSDPPVRLRL
jgi:hypothetical protein